MAGIQSPLQLGNAGDIIGESGLGGGGGGGQPQGAQRHLSPHQFPKLPGMEMPGEEGAGAAEGAAGAGEAAGGAAALEELAPLVLLA